MSAVRAVVIGGDAAGMSAATRIRATDPEAEVIVLEAGRFTSYSACGIPYVVGGEVAGGVEALVARSPDEHRRRGIDVRLHHEATAIDVAAGEVEVHDRHAGGRAPAGLRRAAHRHRGGADPARPARASACRWSTACRRSRTPRRCWRWPTPAAGAPSSSAAATSAWRWPRPSSTEAARPRWSSGAPTSSVCSTATSASASATRCATTASTCASRRRSSASNRDAVLTADGPIPADLVVLGIGVAPRSRLAAEAGIELGARDAVHVDDRQHTSAEHVWAAGDCADATHLVTGRSVHIALGTYANKHGRVAGINIAGGRARSRPVLGTAATKLCDLEIALTGVREHEAADAGIDAVTVSIDATTRAGYFPAAAPMTVRLAFERGTGRVLGAQIVGGPGSAKRIDTVATAITAGMTARDVADLDLAYAPPFSSVWDPVAVAVREALKVV